MKIAIIDDSAAELGRLYTILNNELPTAKYSTFSGAEAFLETWSEGAYDLVFFDIFMDGMLGIDAARTVRDSDSDIKIIFCTTSNEFASESYEVGANYYLHKPISETSVRRMLNMLKLDHFENNRFVRLPDGQRVVLRNVIYTEYYNHTILIHGKNDGDIRTRMSQMELESILLEHSCFYNCSKGIVVNFYEVAQQTDNMFLMSNGAQVPISRRKAKDALQAFASFQFEQMRKG